MSQVDKILALLSNEKAAGLREAVAKNDEEALRATADFLVREYSVTAIAKALKNEYLERVDIAKDNGSHCGIGFWGRASRCFQLVVDEWEGPSDAT